MTHRPVQLAADPSHRSTPALDVIAAAPPLPAAERGVEIALALGPLTPRPGNGETLALLEVLASLGARDLTLARVVEPHLDALSILSEAGEVPGLDAISVTDTRSTWGVYAAEGQGCRLTAEEGPEGWTLTGSKPWCSLAGSLTHALVTAFLDTGDRRLFAVDLADPGVCVQRDGWVSRGLSGVPSTPVSFAHVAAVPVGDAGWYLSRPGFAWGGIGVAAVWHGGMVGIARRLAAQAGERELDQVGEMHLGAVDAQVHASRAVLAEAAQLIDAGRADGAAGSRLALRVRQIVSAAAESVIASAGHAMGPAPLAFEEEHARRTADLAVYIRQDQAERDQAALGRALLADGPGCVPW
ncbi:MAG: acyl-CoA dehydrogenase [Micrococcales bacterium]|nr:acyl-CoA dehydrogenase [Micrococcales bacterium]